MVASQQISFQWNVFLFECEDFSFSVLSWLEISQGVIINNYDMLGTEQIPKNTPWKGHYANPWEAHSSHSTSQTIKGLN